MFDLESQEIFISRDIKFYESLLPFKDKENHLQPSVPLPVVPATNNVQFSTAVDFVPMNSSSLSADLQHGNGFDTEEVDIPSISDMATSDFVEISI